MAITLALSAIDASTYLVRFQFLDEAGAAVTPVTLEWTLTDRRGHIINGRDWAVITPGSAVDIVLTGDDLLYSDGRYRVVTVRGTYNSSVGTGLSLTGEAVFEIVDLLNI